VIQEMNKEAEKKNLGWRFTSLFELVDISISSRRKLDNVMAETLPKDAGIKKIDN
jgi:hypothetical protein